MHQQSIAENIRRLREERHWSQEELAAASDVDVRTIQRAEAGKPLQVESLRAIAAAFNTTIEQLSVSEEGIKAFIENFKKTHRIIELRPVTAAADVTGLLGAEAYYLHKGGTLSEKQADEVASFEQDVYDWGDLWSDLGPIQRRDAEKALGAQLGRIAALRMSVSAGSRMMLLKAPDGGDPMRWRVLYLAVVAGTTPLAALIEEKGQSVSFR